MKSMAIQISVENIFRCLTKKAFWTLAAFFIFLKASFSLAITQKEADDHVGESYGPVISKAKLPETYDILGNLFEVLATASAERITQSDTSSDLAIIDAPVINAFVLTLTEQGISRAKNKIYLTTGLLRLYLGEVYDPVTMKERIFELAGIMAHELGHPADKLDRHGIEAHYDKFEGSQAVEVRADTEAILLLRQAGIPTDSLLKALDRLNRNFKQPAGILEAGKSTHPDFDIRSSAQRSGLTLERLDEGLQENFIDARFDTEVLIKERELYATENKKFIEMVETPKTVEEAVSLFSKMKFRTDKGMQNKLWPANAYAHWIATHFFRLGEYKKWPADQKQVFTEFLKTLTTESKWYARSPSIFTNKRFIKELRQRISSPDLIRSELPVRDLLAKTGFFQSEDFSKFMKKSKSEQTRFSFIRDFLDVAPPENILPYIFETKNSLDLVVAATRTDDYLVKLELYELAIKNLFPKTAQEYIDFLVKHEKRAYLMPIRREKFFRLAFENQFSNIQGKENFTRAQRIAQFYWDRRALIGTAELFGYGLSSQNYGELDWLGIGQILGLDRHQVKSQILSSVKSFLSDKTSVDGLNYSQVLENLKIPTKERSAVNLTKLPMWVDRSLYSYTMGNFIESEEGKALSRSMPHKEMLAKLPEVHRQYVRAELEKELRLLGKKKLTTPLFIKAIEKVYSKAFGSPAGSITPTSRISKFMGSHFIYALEYAVENSKKDRLYEKILVDVFDTMTSSKMISKYAFSGILSNKDLSKALYKIARKSGAATNYPDFIVRIAKSNDSKIAFQKLTQFKLSKRVVQTYEQQAVAAQLAKSLAFEIVEDLQRINSLPISKDQAVYYLERYQSFLGRVGEKNDMPYRDEYTKEMTRLAIKAELSVPAAYQFFSRITKLSVTNETDAYFEKIILPTLESENKTTIVKRVLQSDRIHDGELQVRLAQLHLEPLAQKIVDDNSQNHSGKLFGFAEDVHTMMKKDSSSRDQLIEHFAWKFGPEGRKLKAYFEDEKSTNWRKGNPLFVRAGSALSALLRHFSIDEKFALLGYIMRPQASGGMPPEVFNMILRRYRILGQRGMTEGLPVDQQDPENMAFETKVILESVIANSRPVERVPLIDLIITTGQQNSLIRNESLLGHIIENIMEFEPKSVEHMMLQAYLEVVPTHERSVTLAYVLANKSVDSKGSKKGNLKSILEVFQTVGIKFGQMAATWKIFGPEYQAELEDLNDKAKPMTKAQIEAELERSLLPEERRQIKRFVGILGSASVKSVVLVELVSGEQVALMLRRPNAPEQIRSNTALSKAFIAKLKEIDITSTHPLFQPMVEALEGQLGDEINFIHEVEKIKKVASLLGENGRALDGVLHGWKLKMPGVNLAIKPRENVFLMGVARGVTLKEYLRDQSIPSDEKHAIGEALTRFSLEMLFKHGYFDPDRHSGNWLVDRKTQEISIIDPGQLINFESKRNPFRWDSRLTLAYFMNAMGEKDGKGVVHYAKLMAEKNTGLTAGEESELIKKVTEILNEKTLDQSLQEVVVEIYRSGIKLDQRFSFGALKGFMTLFGQGYVTSDRFVEILTENIKQLALRKAPMALYEGLKGLLRGTEKASGPKAAPTGLKCIEFFRP